MTQSDNSARMPARLLEGSSAVPFELPDQDGQIHTLARYSGRWLLLVFHRHLA